VRCLTLRRRWGGSAGFITRGARGRCGRTLGTVLLRDVPAGGFTACAGALGAARLRRGELAGLPEQEYLFQAGEDAGQTGHDEGVDGNRNPGARLRFLRDAAQAGELVAEGG